MKRVSFIVLIFLPLIAGCSGHKTVQKTETIMGTQVSITVVAKTEQEGEAAIDAAMAEVRRFDRMMSLYKDDSEITRVNLAAGKGPVEVSPEMIEIVEAARKISELTDGAFDVTVGPLVVLWQMRLKEGAAPTETEIESIKNRVGYRNIITDKKASTLFLMKPGMIMDFGGCAKGYVADRVAELLKGRGIDNAIVALAGDIRVMGHRPDGSSWRIGVQHPRDSAKTLTVLELSDKFISTSGDYERYQIVHRKRYHHILDPRTGKPSEGMESVTLVGDRGSDGDPLATALFILGPKQGRKIVKKLGYNAIFVDDKGRVVMTDGIKKIANSL